MGPLLLNTHTTNLTSPFSERENNQTVDLRFSEYETHDLQTVIYSILSKLGR